LAAHHPFRLAQVSLGWSCGLGSGLVVARREEDDTQIVAFQAAIPARILSAVCVCFQVGLGWSCGLGSGLVVARREEDDSWSPPSALTAFSAGWGLQVRPPSIQQVGGMPSNRGFGRRHIAVPRSACLQQWCKPYPDTGAPARAE